MENTLKSYIQLSILHLAILLGAGLALALATRIDLPLLDSTHNSASHIYAFTGSADVHAPGTH